VYHTDHGRRPQADFRYTTTSSGPSCTQHDEVQCESSGLCHRDELEDVKEGLDRLDDAEEYSCMAGRPLGGRRFPALRYATSSHWRQISCCGAVKTSPAKFANISSGTPASIKCSMFLYMSLESSSAAASKRTLALRSAKVEEARAAR